LLLFPELCPRHSKTLGMDSIWSTTFLERKHYSTSSHELSKFHRSRATQFHKFVRLLKSQAFRKATSHLSSLQSETVLRRLVGMNVNASFHNKHQLSNLDSRVGRNLSKAEFIFTQSQLFCFSTSSVNCAVQYQLKRLEKRLLLQCTGCLKVELLGVLGFVERAEHNYLLHLKAVIPLNRYRGFTIRRFRIKLFVTIPFRSSFCFKYHFICLCRG
jgi:hypothetical protein